MMESSSVDTQKPVLPIRSLLRGFWLHLSIRRRMQLSFLLLVMVFSGVAELLSLGAIFPFLAVLSYPERLWRHPFVQFCAGRIGLSEESQLLIPITVLFVLAVVLAAFVRLANLWLNGRLAAALGSDLSCEAYRRTLYQPYEVHVKSNSANVITGSITQINLTVTALRSFLLLLTSSFVAFCLFVGLLLIDPIVAVSALIVFGSIYSLLAVAVRRELQRNSRKISSASAEQLKALQEGLGAIRDVLLDGTQLAYLQIYQNSDRPLRETQAKNFFLSVFPRYALEALGLVFIATLGVLLVLHRGFDGQVIPLLGAMALGAQRLLPALQQIYGGWATIKGYQSAMSDVLQMLSQPLPSIVSRAETLHFQDNILFSGVRFRYDSHQPDVLRGINLEIKCGQRIGLIGTTGSGKSTTVDLLMGLLVPTQGQILVDGIDIHDPMRPELLRAWRSSIAHVPQSIYLADSSIAENIAFGTSKQNIDMDRVRKAADQAQISEFIEAKSDGYACFVGERGIRLSGGQRQRIGIARALYKKAKILILDEATSALDISTERTLMDGLDSLGSEFTTILIAHRLSTVQQCDRVIRLENGEIVLDGPPDKLIEEFGRKDFS